MQPSSHKSTANVISQPLTTFIDDTKRTAATTTSALSPPPPSHATLFSLFPFNRNEHHCLRDAASLDRNDLPLSSQFQRCSSPVIVVLFLSREGNPATVASSPHLPPLFRCRPRRCCLPFQPRPTSSFTAILLACRQPHPCLPAVAAHNPSPAFTVAAALPPRLIVVSSTQRFLTILPLFHSASLLCVSSPSQPQHQSLRSSLSPIGNTSFSLPSDRSSVTAAAASSAIAAFSHCVKLMLANRAL
ncbi:hypothetical protein BHM03_00008922 [Ensete ventricosum]|uniref:Uncharacterized protein n=1 Tax=Ensete ventricosum TaxID=4639 RepID=A0A445MCD6_ENSVE|nr:hypothetical protein BHM03_00008922 [Ensete ventricosum]